MKLQESDYIVTFVMLVFFVIVGALVLVISIAQEDHDDSPPTIFYEEPYVYECLQYYYGGPIDCYAKSNP